MKAVEIAMKEEPHDRENDNLQNQIKNGKKLHAKKKKKKIK